MQNSLVKLIDIALVPAGLMVIGKIAGLFLSVVAFNVPWTIKQISDTFFSIRPAVSAEDILTVGTYSDIFMYIALGIGFSFILLQATRFHESHIQPRTLIRLSNSNLLGLVKSSFDIYHVASIWLIFLWMSLIVVLIDIVMSKTEIWVGLVCLIGNVIFTTVLLQDVYNEIDLSRKNLGSQSALA